MWYVDDILRYNNFDKLSKNELLEIIMTLSNELKYHKYKKDKIYDELNTKINILNSQIQSEKKEIDRLTTVNNNYRNKIVRGLTFWERIKGRIDTKN